MAKKIQAQIDNRPLMFSLVMVRKARACMTDGMGSRETLALLTEFARVKYQSIFEIQVDTDRAEQFAIHSMQYILPR